MKAWIVKEKDEFGASVVFAETRGKARSIAKDADVCEDANFCDIEVRRAPQMDKYYKEGKKEMNWLDMKDRIALVKECGFRCDCIDLSVCNYCPAKKYCDAWKDNSPFVEVVRCKDCKKRNTSDCAMRYECSVCGGQWSWEADNAFCSFGERKEE